MQKNYSQRLEMQIPKENTFVGLTNTPSINHELEKLSKNYTIRKSDELKEYFEKDERLIPYIHSITPLIKEYFPDKKIYLTYCIDPEFKELDQAIICVIGDDSSFEEEHALMNALNDELLYSTEYPVEVKSLIFVRMWWL